MRDDAGPLLMELDTQVSHDDLHAALAARGLVVITNPLTQRPRIAPIPPLLQPLPTSLDTVPKRRKRA